MNQLYIQARRKFLDGDLSWRDQDIRALLVDLADYTPNFASDEFLDDVPLVARVGTSYLLTGKTSLLGTADADDVILPAVVGDVSEAILLFVDTGIEATSALIAYIDVATNLPFTPTGSDLLVVWDPVGIFTL